MESCFYVAFLATGQIWIFFCKDNNYYVITNGTVYSWGNGQCGAFTSYISIAKYSVGWREGLVRGEGNPGLLFLTLAGHLLVITRSCIGIVVMAVLYYLLKLSEDTWPVLSLYWPYRIWVEKNRSDRTIFTGIAALERPRMGNWCIIGWIESQSPFLPPSDPPKKFFK